MENRVLLERRGSLAVIRLNRPEGAQAPCPPAWFPNWGRL